MSQSTVFSHSNYKAFIKFQISEEPESWGLMTKLAKAAGCQRPYLSRVLNEEAHLTPAQVYGLAKFWNLTDEETEFFLGLLEIQKAGSAEYREFWLNKNKEAKDKRQSLSKLLEREIAPFEEKDLLYYSAWFWTGIHIAATIPEYQTEKAIAERLALPTAQVKMVLQSLEKWGYVFFEKGKWKANSRNTHIPKESPLSAFHANNWRQKAILNAQSRDPQSIHFTAIQSVSKADYEKIKDLILTCLQKAAKIAGPSKEEKLMCFTLDCFEP